MSFSPCRWAGCPNPPARSGICALHARARYHNGGSRDYGRVLTDAERAEIVRRVQRFESPLSVAKAMGITTRTVTRVMKARAS